MTVVTPITPGQQKQYKRFVEDAAERALQEAGLDKDGIQNLIENGDEFQNRIIAGIRELSVPNQFADEEVASSYAYPNGYKVKGITEQINILRRFFPGIRQLRDEQVKLAERPLPPNAEGWFAIPRWQKVAPTYGEALEKVLALIKETRNGKFYNYREGKLGPQYLRQHDRTMVMWKKLGDQQTGHDILVVSAQLGLHHRGRSVRRAREVFTREEFGLGPFAVGIMLLTNPERLVRYEDLWIDCGGDEYAPGADGGFDCAPCFVFDDDGLKFDADLVDDANDGYGCASAFLE